MRLVALAILVALGAPAAALAQSDPAPTAAWRALASDRLAGRVGDTLTVLINEAASASNTAQNGAKKNTRLAARAATGTRHVESADLGLASTYDGQGQSGRADRMLASISVTVTDVLPNGDLRVAGERVLNMNGEQTRIRVRGRVRPVDIASANTVLSSRLAEAEIDYNGSGFVARSARPGILSRLLGGLGLF